MEKNIGLPLLLEDIKQLKAGDKVKLSGVVYTARDAAHKRLYESLEKGQAPPFELEGSVLYYVGPTPAKPGHTIGSAGPTTSGRMDSYTPKLLAHGLKGMIGKGYRSDEVKTAITHHQAIYFAAIGGAAALIAKSIKSSTIIAYEDLGTEAIRKLEIENFPAIVIHDMYGGDLYKIGVEQYRQS